jgi:hypothetical protein
MIRPKRLTWAHTLRPTFESRVLPVSEDVIFNGRLLVEDGRRPVTRCPSAIYSSVRRHFIAD